MRGMSGAPSRTPDEARAILATELVRLAPRRAALGEAGAYAVAAWTLMHAFEFEASVLGWATVLEHAPRDVEAVFRHAHCLLELGKYDAAAEGFRAAHALDAELADDPAGEGLDWLEDDPAYRLGNCLHASGDLPAAVEAYEESARRNTIGIESLREIARCHLATGSTGGALDAIGRMESRASSLAVRADALALRAEAHRIAAGGAT